MRLLHLNGCFSTKPFMKFYIKTQMREKGHNIKAINMEKIRKEFSKTEEEMHALLSSLSLRSKLFTSYILTIFKQ